jgi:hypothetical protein
MPAQIDTLALSQALKGAGLKASADGVARAMQDIAMRDAPSNSDIREAVHTMTVRMGIMVAGSTLAIVIAVVAALISISN